MDTHDLHSSAEVTREPSTPSGIPAEPGLQVIHRDDGLWFSQQSGRQWGVPVSAAAFGLLCLIVPLTVGEPLPEYEIAIRGVKVVSMFFGVCLLLLASYQSAQGLDVRVDRQRIERIRRWGGITLMKRSVHTSDVEDLWILKDVLGSRVSYSLDCRGRFGSLRLLGGIRSRENLERLRRQIMLAAGIRPSGTY